MVKSFLGQFFPGLLVHIAFFLQHMDQVFVAVRVRDDDNVMEVLGRSPHHGRAADIDVLDGFGFGHVRFRDGLFEGIQVHHHQVDGFDAVLLHVFHVFRVAAYRQDAAVDLRVQGLHPAVHHFRGPGHVAHIGAGHAGLLQHLHGAAGGDDLHAVVVQEIAQLHDAGLIRNAQ